MPPAFISVCPDYGIRKDVPTFLTNPYPIFIRRHVFNAVWVLVFWII